MIEITPFDTFAKGTITSSKIRGTNCVIYTRVSSREQADNLSLGTQLKGCNQYAERLKYKVLAQFGGTYESAENDERKEFIAMLAFVKKAREKVSYILVYSLERFSRNDNSIWLSGELRKLGIEIVSVTQPIDTSSASGQMQQKMLFLFGEFDNQLRKQKCTAGIKEMLLRGDWPTAAPLGFDIVRINGIRKIIVNEKGKLLRQAYEWKSQYNLSNEAIRGKLAEKGLKLNHQRISEIFRNPFYCGLMAHNMLEGRVVEGNQEKLISKATFLKVNGILDQNAHGYSLKEENEAIPLKRFTKCAECGKPLTGYLMRKKNIHYYKCKTRGCNTNKNAKSLNETFYNLLNNFTLSLDRDFLQLIRQQAIATFNQLFKGEEEAYVSLVNQYKELKKKIDRLEERYIEEEINGELYNKFSEKYLLEKDELEGKILKASKKSSNLGDCIDISLEIASKMAEKWVLSDYVVKQKIQSLVFPDGITFSKKKEEVRTPRINFLFLYMTYFQQLISNKKSGIPELNLDFAAFACLVAGSRIELPTLGL
ncbi:recombinase family protein [Mucilaginibacter flavus]|uniref:recombinase family protein n=1 Tax=Mucilaginibacter flavus TaxID=931504 RepID=UPI0033904A6B